MVRIKRAYDRPEAADGARFLVDRLWPRGLKREGLELTGWLKEVAPSDDLRRWFGHDPDKWKGFRGSYFAELDARPETWRPLLEAAQKGTVTLLFGAKDLQHNNAAALRTYLETKLKAKGRKRLRGQANLG
jgi:uncharacterized protein YeaO (DUF488 family)